jgi:hypothetical protein
VGGCVGRLVPAVIETVVGGVVVGVVRSSSLVLGRCHETGNLVGGDAGDRGDLQPRQGNERQHRPGQLSLPSPDPLQASHDPGFSTADGGNVARPSCACNSRIPA